MYGERYSETGQVAWSDTGIGPYLIVEDRDQLPWWSRLISWKNIGNCRSRQNCLVVAPPNCISMPSAVVTYKISPVLPPRRYRLIWESLLYIHCRIVHTKTKVLSSSGNALYWNLINNQAGLWGALLLSSLPYPLSSPSTPSTHTPSRAHYLYSSLTHTSFQLISFKYLRKLLCSSGIRNSIKFSIFSPLL